MKTIPVVAAIICDSLEAPTRVLATARGYGQFAGMWEFPGGKVEPGEAPEQALVREIDEELGCAVFVGERVYTVEYDYPDFHLSMDCFWCTVTEGEIVLREAAEARWLDRSTLQSVNWLPADYSLVEVIGERLGRSEGNLRGI